MYPKCVPNQPPNHPFLPCIPFPKPLQTRITDTAGRFPKLRVGGSTPPSPTRIWIKMMSMGSLHRSWGAAVSCVLALSLIIGVSCAPICAGTACLPRGTNVQEDSSCHGMPSHDASTASLTARGSACKISETAVAVLGKTNFAVHQVSPADDAIVTNSFPQSFAASISGDSLAEGSPGAHSPRVPTLVLRV